jgi:hypothetical protein
MVEPLKRLLARQLPTLTQFESDRGNRRVFWIAPAIPGESSLPAGDTGQVVVNRYEDPAVSRANLGNAQRSAPRILLATETLPLLIKVASVFNVCAK